MSVKEERIWAGSQTSYDAALDAETRIAAGQYMEPPDEDEAPRLLTVDGGLGIITIKGPLMNSDSPMLAMFGATGYPEIRDAIVAAVNDPEVKEILLDCDSGGGAVSGCDDTGNLIRAAHQVKPVTAYGDTMASAMYWLASSAGRVYSSKSALVGSIGVKATFREYSKQNEKDGVTVTVIRSGKYKALADSNEPLSAEGRAQIQAMTDAAYEVFVDHVATMRGRTYEYADKTMADGQEFIGQAAADVGLTDGITTFDAVVGGLKKKILASSSKTMDNRGVNSVRLSGESAAHISGDAGMAKKALTEQDIAALAAGAGDVKVEASTGEVPIVEAEAPVTEGEQPTVEGEATAPVVEGEAATPVTEGTQPAKIDATVQLLNAQLQAKDDALLQAGIKIARLEEANQKHEASLQPLMEIVGRSANIMHISLGGHERQFASMSPADLVVEHCRLSKEFSKFPVGGVAAVSDDTPATPTQVDPRHMARVSAARFHK